MFYILQGKRNGKKYKSVVNVKPGINKVYLGSEVKRFGYRNIKVDRITKEKAKNIISKKKLMYTIPNIAKGWRIL